MSTLASPMNTEVMAHHEAGHAVAALVLGIPFIEVRIVPGENGKIGVDFKVMPWTSPRPETKLGGFTDVEWKEVSRDDSKWEAWQKTTMTTRFSCWQEKPPKSSTREQRGTRTPDSTTRSRTRASPLLRTPTRLGAASGAVDERLLGGSVGSGGGTPKTLEADGHRGRGNCQNRHARGSTTEVQSVSGDQESRELCDCLPAMVSVQMICESQESTCTPCCRMRSLPSGRVLAGVLSVMP